MSKNQFSSSAIEDLAQMFAGAIVPFYLCHVATSCIKSE